jgi:hypothetical protein
LKRAVGTAVASTLALALLVAGCVFAAMAGPALSLHARSQALHQTTGQARAHDQDRTGQRELDQFRR